MTAARPVPLLARADPTSLAVAGSLALAAGLAMVGGSTLAIGVVGAAAALALTVRAPGAILALYLLIPYYKAGVQPYLPVDLTLILAVLNGAQVFVLARERRLTGASMAGLALWFGLAGLVLAGVTWAPQPAAALAKAVNYWLLVALPLVPAAIRVGSSERHVRQLLWTMFGLGVIVVVVGVTNVSAASRLTVLGANTIGVSRAALLVPVVGLSLFLRDRIPGPTLLTLILVPASLLVAVASGSRGPLLVAIGLAVLGAIMYVIRRRGAGRRVVLGVAGLAIATAAVISVAAEELPESSLQRFQLIGDFASSGLSGDLRTTSGDISAGIRVTLFATAAEMFADHPLLGVGTGGFEALSPRYVSPFEADAYPHNSILQIASELGLVGLLVFGGLVLLAMFRPLGETHAAAALRTAFLFFFLNTMLSGDIMSDRESLGLLLLILCIDVVRFRKPIDARGAPRRLDLLRYSLGDRRDARHSARNLAPARSE